MIESISDIKTKNMSEWFKADTPPEAISLVTKMLAFNPLKRITINEVLRHTYLAKFHNVKEEIECPKIIHPPISDNTKLNLKQYRNLIYDRIKKIYKESATQEKNKENLNEREREKEKGNHSSQHSYSNHVHRKSKENIQNTSSHAINNPNKNSRSSLKENQPYQPSYVKDSTNTYYVK